MPGTSDRRHIELLPLLLSELRQTLEARALDSFAIYIAKLSVRQATHPEYRNLPKIELIEESYTVYLTLKACPNYGAFSFTLPANVPRNPKSGIYNFEATSIKWVGKWVNFEKFLDELVSHLPFYQPIGTEGVDALWSWYQHNGRPFRFLDLPKELRLALYEFTIGDDVYPQLVREPPVGRACPIYLWSVTGISLGHGWVPTAPRPELEGTHDQADEVPAPDAALLAINHQIREEALAVVWSYSRGSFASLSVLKDVTRWSPTFLPSNSLKRIGLNLDNYDYFHLFGVRVALPMMPEYADPPYAEYLQTAVFPNLKTLDLKFRSTRWGPYDSPWTTTNMRWPLSELVDAEDAWAWDSACQRAVTMMILTLALDYVYKIKEVNVEGYVKHSTKEAFERALKEKKEHPHETPSWPTTKKCVYRFTERDSPPLCRCTTPCGFWGVKVLLNPGPQGRKQRKLRQNPVEIFEKYSFDYED